MFLSMRMSVERRVRVMSEQTVKWPQILLTKVVATLLLATVIIFMIYNVLQPGYSLAADNAKEKNILILDSFHQDLPISKLFLKGMQERLAEQSTYKINYEYEYLDLQTHNGNSAYNDHLPDYLKEKYSIQKPDLIIAHRRLAFDFMVKNGEKIFPGISNIPVISVGDEREKYSNKAAPPNFVQVIGSIDMAESFKVLLQTKPKTKQIYVLIGTTPLEKKVKENLSSQVSQFAGNVEISYLDYMTVPEMLEKVSTITGDAAIMYVFVFKDVTGTNFIPSEVLKDIISYAKVPVYGLAKTYLGTGIVGGYVVSGEVLGKRVADIGIEILQGNNQTHFEKVPSTEYIFDWRQLKRWDINESLLPPGSKIEFKEQGLWDLYRWHVLGASILLVLETFLIFGLLTNRMKRKRAEASLLKLNDELEHKVAKRTHDLEVINTELREAKNNQEEMNHTLLQLNEQLHWNSRTDVLTGLFNRRHITEKIQAEFEAFHHISSSFSLIIADVDHFKQVNDVYGHNGGDFILGSLAKEFTKAIRSCDTVARWGGEEFLCLLPATDTITAMAIAERMRSIVADQNFVWEGNSLKISMTFGVATIGKGDTVDRLIGRADQALYWGKKTGRNRVVDGNDLQTLLEPVKRIKWNKDWESGNQIIDQQHRQLLEISTNIVDLFVFQAPSSQIATQLDHLLEHLIRHFFDEEELMTRLGYTEIKAHALVHENIIKDARRIKGNFLGGQFNSTDFFDFLVGNIIMKHLLTDDVKFFPRIREMKKEEEPM